jgi:threonine/homoserine/homoserine lactone efflux protein
MMLLLAEFSSSLFINGLVTGLLLTSMVGPITLTILRYGVVVGHRAGLAAAAGTWLSDIVFILPTWFLTAGVEGWLEQPGVKPTLHVLGGLGLIALGGQLVRKTRHAEVQPADVTRRHHLQAFVAGFFVNSFSPFTLFFWLGAAVFLRAADGWAGWYYMGLMTTLMAGDTAKAWMAPKLAARVAAHHYRWFEIGAGVVVALSGGYVIVRGIVGV